MDNEPNVENAFSDAMSNAEASNAEAAPLAAEEATVPAASDPPAEPSELEANADSENEPETEEADVEDEEDDDDEDIEPVLEALRSTDAKAAKKLEKVFGSLRSYKATVAEKVNIAEQLERNLLDPEKAASTLKILENFAKQNGSYSEPKSQEPAVDYSLMTAGEAAMHQEMVKMREELKEVRAMNLEQRALAEKAKQAEAQKAQFDREVSRVSKVIAASFNGFKVSEKMAARAQAEYPGLPLEKAVRAKYADAFVTHNQRVYNADVKKSKSAPTMGQALSNSNAKPAAFQVTPGDVESAFAAFSG